MAGLVGAMAVGGVVSATADKEGRRASARAASPAERPNIVLITSDDQALTDLRWMPRTRMLIGGAGVRFSGAIAPNPLCCPARATLLTGQYSHNNGVRGNKAPHGGYAALDNSSTIATWLDAAGYNTAFVGKYLNGYKSRRPTEPGWESFDALIKGIYRSYGFTLSGNGAPVTYRTQHSNDVIAARTTALVDRYSAQGDPFFIWSSYVAPHGTCTSTNRNCSAPPVPAKRHAKMYASAKAPQVRRSSFNEADVSDKPAVIRHKKRVTRARAQRLFTQRIRTLASLDEAVGATIAALRANDQLDNTLIIFTSDNGYQIGEHRHIGKVLPYEEALRVPLLMRGPGVPAGTLRGKAVSHVDIASTIARAAGASPGRPVDGRDLRPLAARAGWAPYTHVIASKGDGNRARWTYRGIRDQRYTYVQWSNGFVELYDRKRDPRQLRNVAGKKKYRAVRQVMATRFRALKNCSGAECRRTFPSVPGPR